MIKIPNINKKWIQTNNSDLFGNVYVTKNITFDKEGYLRLSYSPRACMNETKNADFDNVASILFTPDYNQGFLAATWDKIFDIPTNILSSYPTLDTTSGVPTTDDETDMAWFEDKIVVSQDTDVDYYNTTTSSWVDTNITLTSDGQHPIVNFRSLSAIAICDVNTVKLYATPFSATPALIQTLVLPSDLEITDACYLNQKMFIATKHIQGEHAFVYVWNGTSSSAQEAYEVDANTIFGITPHRSSVVCFTSSGELMRYTGGSFQTIAKIPSFYENQNLTDYLNKTLYHGMIKSNGDLIYINLSNQKNSTDRLLDMPDGIWCFDENVGLYHRYSNTISLMEARVLTSSAVNTTDNTITSTGIPVTGTEVFYNPDISSIGGLTANKKYFVIKISDTVFKLATTKANAIAGNAIDLTSATGSSLSFIFFPNIDFGSYLSSRTFTTKIIDFPTETPLYGIDLLWSSETETRILSSTNNSFLKTVSPELESRGYFITPKVLSSGVKDNYNNLTIKFRKLKNELDKIIIKYRTTDDAKEKINTSEWVATWTSVNTFTTTNTDIVNARVGDEIEFLGGAGAGILAHITSISDPVAGVYTVTIDENFDNYISGDKAIFIYRNWKKLATISYGEKISEDGFFQRQIDGNGKFIQFKIELRGMGILVEELSITNKTDLPN